jgi:hypothetical protein
MAGATTRFIQAWGSGIEIAGGRTRSDDAKVVLENRDRFIFAPKK